MAKNKSKKKTRAEPIVSSNQSFFVSQDSYATLIASNYRRLVDNPEVKIAVDKIANLVSSMTIYLMENTENGDKRVRNELARKIDIDPYSLSTRKTWIYNIVSNLYLEGEGNSIVYPKIKNGLIEDLIPLPPSRIRFEDTENAYKVIYKERQFAHDEIIHFVINPNPDKPYMGQGYKIVLKDVIQNIKQATKTKKGFMESKYLPPVIISVDALTEELTTKEGKERILKEYAGNTEAGVPWVIPGGMVEVKSVKPLTLRELALNEAVDIDKKTVAGIFGVPPFFLGVGSYNKEEYNNFVDTTILPLAKVIEQELTKKLIISNNMYFKFNVRSLYAYNMNDMIRLISSMIDRNAMRRNEGRDLLGLEPDDDMNELLALENYVPADRLGDQKKLNNNSLIDVETTEVSIGKSIKEISLNGTQVQSLVNVVQLIAKGELPRDTGVELILVAFPSIDKETAENIIGEAGKEFKLESDLKKEVIN